MEKARKSRLNKKVLTILLTAICLLSICVGATLAILTSVSGPLENVFTVGNIGLELTETTGSSYQLIPGKTHNKDPKITVMGGSESCWLFAKITKSSNFDDYMSYELNDGWTHLGGYDGVYYRSVDGSDINQYFYILKNNSITVKDNLTEEKASAISALPTITFSAYAVQSHSVETASEAWHLILKEG